MTREDIIRMAMDVGFVAYGEDAGEYRIPTPAFHGRLERFAELVAAAEREACAKVCEEKESYAMTIPCPDGIQGCCVMHTVPATRMRTANECAAAIRARSNT